MAVSEELGTGDINMRRGPLRRRLYRLVDRIDVSRSGGRDDRRAVADTDADRVASVDGDARGDGRAFDGDVDRDAVGGGRGAGRSATEAAEHPTD